MSTEKILSPSDPEFLPVEYDMTAAKLEELAKLYDASTIPEAKEKGDDGYLVIHERAMAIVTVRTSIEKKRKALKSDALAWGKKVDGEAKRLTDIVKALEEPWKKIKDELDEKEAKESEAKRLEEQRRLEAIEKKIADIKDLTSGLVGNDAAALNVRLETVHEVVITESEYGDYVEAAELTKQTVTDELTKALAERVTFEDDQAKLQEAKDAQDKQAADLQAQQDEIDKERQKLVKDQADQKAREEAEEARKKQEAKDRQAEIERQEREKQAAIDKEKADEQAALDKEASEKKEAADKKKREADLKKRLPEDIKVRDYVAELLEVEAPTVKNPEMKLLIVDIRTELKRVQMMVSKRTQETKA